jgi:transcriptional regulator with XRE-family HTH domain
MAARPQHALSYRQMCVLLTKWREKAGISQRELSQRLKKPITYANKVEAGIRRIDPIELAAWCRACSVEPVDAYRQVVG